MGSRAKICLSTIKTLLVVVNLVLPRSALAEEEKICPHLSAREPTAEAGVRDLNQSIIPGVPKVFGSCKFVAAAEPWLRGDISSSDFNSALFRSDTDWHFNQRTDRPGLPIHMYDKEEQIALRRQSAVRWEDGRPIFEETGIATNDSGLSGLRSLLGFGDRAVRDTGAQFELATEFGERMDWERNSIVNQTANSGASRAPILDEQNKLIPNLTNEQFLENYPKLKANNLALRKALKKTATDFLGYNANNLATYNQIQNFNETLSERVKDRETLDGDAAGGAPGISERLNQYANIAGDNTSSRHLKGSGLTKMNAGDANELLAEEKLSPSRLGDLALQDEPQSDSEFRQHFGNDNNAAQRDPAAKDKLVERLQGHLSKRELALFQGLQTELKDLLASGASEKLKAALTEASINPEERALAERIAAMNLLANGESNVNLGIDSDREAVHMENAVRPSSSDISTMDLFSRIKFVHQNYYASGVFTRLTK